MPESYTGNGVFKRFLLGALLIIAASAAGTAVAAVHEVNAIVDVFTRPGHELNLKGVVAETKPGKPQTILLIGSDRRAKTSIDARLGLIGKPHSDTMILMRLDPSKQATALMSLPRDLKVHIPGHGTDKLNASYALGGSRLVVRTIQGLTGLQVNHVINVNFGGFRDAIDELHCVYVDVDRRYYNQSNAYAKIDISPGYQRLCGENALAYVRYRHEDNDLVRAARQQDFLRDLKSQVSFGSLFSHRHKLEDIFARNTRSDIHSRSAVIRLLRLVIASATHPIREIHFKARLGPSYVYSSESVIRRLVRQFLGLQQSKGPRGVLTPRSPRERRKAARAVSGLADASAAGRDQALQAKAQHAGFPVYYPTVRTLAALFAGPPRVYRIRAHGHSYRAYRMVLKRGYVGEYYGVQGTTWMDPPILDESHVTKTVRRRKLYVYLDGDRVRLVAWKTRRAVYWISNTLLQTLSRRQMIEMAATARPLA